MWLFALVLSNREHEQMLETINNYQIKKLQEKYIFCHDLWGQAEISNSEKNSSQNPPEYLRNRTHFKTVQKNFDHISLFCYLGRSMEREAHLHPHLRRRRHCYLLLPPCSSWQGAAIQGVTEVSLQCCWGDRLKATATLWFLGQQGTDHPWELRSPERGWAEVMGRSSGWEHLVAIISQKVASSHFSLGLHLYNLW